MKGLLVFLLSRLSDKAAKLPSDRLVDEEWLAGVLHFWDRTLEVKGLGQDNFEDLQILSVWLSSGSNK